MKVKAIITGLNLTEDRVYDVIEIYDTVYEIKCDDGYVYCRNKGFFEVVEK